MNIPDNVYENTNPERLTHNVAFKDITDSSGLDYIHKKKKYNKAAIPKSIMLQPGRKRPKKSRQLGKLIANQKQLQGPLIGSYVTAFLDPFPGVSVVDINLDGYMDLYFTQSENNPNKLYINNKGESFTEMADAYGIGEVNLTESSSQAIFHDFDNDGMIDMLLLKWGCHKYFRGQGPSKPFILEPQKLGGLCSFARTGNLIDYNHDNVLDLVIANYSNSELEYEGMQILEGTFVGNKYNGDINYFFQLDQKGNFKLKPEINFNNWKSLTHAAGILDMNGDGWDDIFFTNDYSSDEVWINNQKGNFTEETTRYFSPMSKHGYSGMNSEVMDINNDGLEEIYISNAYKPPYQNTINNLWQHKIKDEPFDRTSEDYKIGKCGYSWGAKFFDVDNNGRLDLLVTNGRQQSENKLKKKGFYSWFDSIEFRSIPSFLKKYSDRHITKPGLQTFPEKNCLFYNEGKEFSDIASSVGITDLLDGRGLALIDIDNDGHLDFSITNYHGKALLYKNNSSKTGNWIGLSLVGEGGIPLIGAKVKVSLQDGTIIQRIMRPLNGFKAQTDPRFHIGLGAQTIKKIEIQYHNKSYEYSDYKINKYNKFEIISRDKNHVVSK